MRRMKEDIALRKYLSFLKTITDGEGKKKKSSHSIAMRLITELVRAVRADEREECAKVAQRLHTFGIACDAIATAIRGRK